ncbi:MAG: Ig-like domain-containing protein [Lachnospiraceae bacterium]|nr:Ig-like domain-containing protein [Lachnospiraceae bacterium]
MKEIKKTLALFLSVFMIFGLMPVLASADEPTYLDVVGLNGYYSSNVTGTYVETGTVNSKPYYANSNGFYISYGKWVGTSLYYWFISKTIGDSDINGVNEVYYYDSSSATPPLDVSFYPGQTPGNGTNVKIVEGNPLPIMSVKYGTSGDVTVSNGDTSPSLSDGTDFGELEASVETQANDFRIANGSTLVALNLTGASPYVSISGTNASDFSVSTIPSSSIVASGTSNFSITFSPQSEGLKRATVSIANNSATNPYTFDIKGTGVSVPGAPSNVTATADDTRASVSFSSPSSNGGKEITSYVIKTNPETTLTYGTESPITVEGLTNGVAYSFAVAAINSVGTGAYSSDSNSVTPYIIEPEIESIDLPDDGSYAAGSDLEFSVSFSENVTVVGLPYISFDIGGVSKQAGYQSGSGTDAVTFKYTVASGDNDDNGISVAGINLNTGSMKDSDDNDADLTFDFAGLSTSNILVDTTAPYVESIERKTPEAEETNSQSVIFKVTFSENVSGVDTGDFEMAATGTVSGSILSVSSSSGEEIDVTVNNLSNEGTLGINFKSSGTNVLDGAGNLVSSGFTSGEKYTVDRIAPSAPSIPDLETASDTGVSSSDNITSAANTTFTGTAEAESTVNLYSSVSGLLDSVETNATGTWTASIILSEGTHSITVKAIDSFGNESSLSLALSVLIDRTAPSAPSVPDLDTNDDTGVSSSDNITNEVTPKISGTAEALSTVYISVDGSGIIKTVNANSSGEWSFDDYTFNEGSYTLIASAMDAAGNTSGYSSGLALEIDETAPSVPTNLSVTPSGGTVLSNILNMTNTNMTASATITAGEATGGYAELYIGGTLRATDSTISVSDTRVNFDMGASTAAGLQAAIPSGGEVKVKLYDAAGNNVETTANNPTLDVDYTGPTAPTSVTAAALGGTVVANTLNGTNTGMSASAIITAGEATGGYAELYVGGNRIATDNTILELDTEATFSTGTSSTAGLQAVISQGGEVKVKLYDIKGNYSVSSVLNPTLLIDYVSPLAPTNVIITPSGGTVVSNVLNATNTNMTIFATIIAGEASDGYAELYIGGTLKGSDTSISGTDTLIDFDMGATTAAELQSAVSEGGNVTVRLYDKAGNSVLGSLGYPTLTADYVLPSVESLTPANGNVIAVVRPSFSIEFTENIAKGSGNLEIYSSPSNSLIESIDVTDDRVSVVDDTVRFSLTDSLSYEGNYYIKIDDGAFLDFAENKYSGISDNTTWAFIFILPSDDEGEDQSDQETENLNGVEIIVNGESNIVGNINNSANSSGRITSTLIVNAEEFEDILEGEENRPVIEIPILTGADIAVGQFNGQTVKDLEEKDAIIVVRTSTSTYTLQASQINIDAISEAFGENVNLSDITVNITISEPSDKMARLVESAERNGSFSIVVPAVEYTITCKYGGKTVQISSFNSYVERMIAIPDGVDPEKITTGIVVEPDGSTHHVPTQIVIVDGKYYAKVSSLTNSVYAVVHNPVEFEDVSSHWAKDAINDMGSRMIVSGIDDKNYKPNREITRAEFAAIIVRALGLSAEPGESSFSDVGDSDWFCKYINTAAKYGIISGYDDGNFKPYNKLTREQAMAIISRAMDITGLDTALKEDEIAVLFSGYADSEAILNYAKDGVGACLKAGIISGRGDGKIAPKENITRAEIAVIIKNLLKKSGLI